MFKKLNDRVFPKADTLSVKVKHPFKIMEFRYGHLLGDGYRIPAERKTRANAASFRLTQGAVNQEYLEDEAAFLRMIGYSINKDPKLTKVSKTGFRSPNPYLLRVETYRFSSFWDLYNIWYPITINVNTGVLERKKVVPRDVEKYRSARTLAKWIMDDGGAHGSAFSIHTNSFTWEEVERLCNIINTKFDLKSYPYWKYKGATQRETRWPIIYIPAASINQFIMTVYPFVHPSRRYKLEDIGIRNKSWEPNLAHRNLNLEPYMSDFDRFFIPKSRL
jgi:hypothetical protein